MQFLKPTTEHRRTFSNIQITDLNESEFHSKSNADESYIEETCIESRSPTLLKNRDRNECTSALAWSSKSKTAQCETLFPSSPFSRSSTPLSSASNSQKRKKSDAFKKSSTEQSDRFEEFITGQVAQPQSEATAFCNFIKTRLEKFNRQFYLEATHNIMSELMKFEKKAEEHQK
ncbi:uncharacterized protein LOC120356774 isoform X1 [Solenopsis invicta]|uniref:uncharacterized protein LOC120356774 isoform X1 n=1 Tax=Solenopsis invicta TaxID=13686 RepID=UPI000595E625|nr:uncharacterized protein LOC120356774 isoform X1 [Solenopsis invicta]